MKGFLSHISFDISEEILNNAHPEDFYTGQGKRYVAIGFVLQLAYLIMSSSQNVIFHISI